MNPVSLTKGFSAIMILVWFNFTETESFVRRDATDVHNNSSFFVREFEYRKFEGEKCQTRTLQEEHCQIASKMQRLALEKMGSCINAKRERQVLGHRKNTMERKMLEKNGNPQNLLVLQTSRKTFERIGVPNDATFRDRRFLTPLHQRNFARNIQSTKDINNKESRNVNLNSRNAKNTLLSAKLNLKSRSRSFERSSSRERDLNREVRTYVNSRYGTRSRDISHNRRNIFRDSEERSRFSERNSDARKTTEATRNIYSDVRREIRSARLVMSRATDVRRETARNTFDKFSRQELRVCSSLEGATQRGVNNFETSKCSENDGRFLMSRKQSWENFERDTSQRRTFNNERQLSRILSVKDIRQVRNLQKSIERSNYESRRVVDPRRESREFRHERQVDSRVNSGLDVSRNADNSQRLKRSVLEKVNEPNRRQIRLNKDDTTRFTQLGQDVTRVKFEIFKNQDVRNVRSSLDVEKQRNVINNRRQFSVASTERNVRQIEQQSRQATNNRQNFRKLTPESLKRLDAKMDKPRIVRNSRSLTRSRLNSINASGRNVRNSRRSALEITDKSARNVENLRRLKRLEERTDKVITISSGQLHIHSASSDRRTKTFGSFSIPKDLTDIRTVNSLDRVRGERFRTNSGSNRVILRRVNINLRVETRVSPSRLLNLPNGKDSVDVKINAEEYSRRLTSMSGRKSIWERTGKNEMREFRIGNRENKKFVRLIDKNLVRLATNPNPTSANDWNFKMSCYYLTTLQVFLGSIILLQMVSSISNNKKYRFPALDSLLSFPKVKIS